MAMTPHQLWNNACKYDKFPSVSPLVSFSKGNPWAKRYDKVAAFIISVKSGAKQIRSKRGTWDKGAGIRERIYIAPPMANDKLGNMGSFPLIEGESCPGKTKFCKLCYGNKGAYLFTKKVHLGKGRPIEDYSSYRNYTATKDPDFVPVMIDELKKMQDKFVREGHKGEQLFRPHPTGDLYSEEYIKKWQDIVKNVPEIKFGFYTRSWRIPKLHKELKELSKLPNANMLASTDPTSGKPVDWLPESGIGGSYTDTCRTCKCEKGEKTCAECKHCYTKGTGGVTLYPHSMSKKDLPQLSEWERNPKEGWKRDPDEIWSGKGGRLLAIPSEWEKKHYGKWSRKHKSKRTTSKVSRVR